MPGSVICKIVDEMLLKKVPFKYIVYITGWSENELWDYIDMHFRIKNREFSKENKHYFVWGESKQLSKTR